MLCFVALHCVTLCEEFAEAFNHLAVFVSVWHFIFIFFYVATFLRHTMVLCCCCMDDLCSFVDDIYS